MIPFSRPYFNEQEKQYISESLSSGHWHGDGPFTHKVQAFLEKVHPGAKAFLTTSCTDALEMSALLLRLQPQDEVIVPSFTFVSSANAYAMQGARPVFVDVRRDTLNIDESKIEAAITTRTKAIVIVHYAGIACEMNAILKLAQKHNLQVIEDNAHGFFGKYQGKSLGTMGTVSTLSFHDTKNFSCGEGGALIVNDPKLKERAEIIREKGTNRSRFLRGEVDKYTWVDLGSSYLPSDLLAAILLAQLERNQEIQLRRQHIWQTYHERLKDWAHRNEVQLPTIPLGADPAYHIFYMIPESLAFREALFHSLKKSGIAVSSHYVPLHLSPMASQMGISHNLCPVTEHVAPRLLRLPLHHHLQDADVRFIIETILTLKM